MADDEAREVRDVRARAELAGLAIRPEDLPGLVEAWLLIEPHLAKVLSAQLGPDAEPAALFRP